MRVHKLASDVSVSRRLDDPMLMMVTFPAWTELTPSDVATAVLKTSAA